MKSSKIFNYSVNLIESEEEITAISKIIKGLEDPLIGIDTETTGLDYITDQVAGFCFSYHCKGVIEGYYIPISHPGSFRANPERVAKFATWLLRNFKTFFFNRDFDYFMLEKTGCSYPLMELVVMILKL